jgi:hypothetical protein
MPNDAKLGLVVGVGLVLTVAVVFFRKDALNPPPAVAVKPVSAADIRPAPVVNGQRPAPGRKVARGSEEADTASVTSADDPSEE